MPEYRIKERATTRVWATFQDGTDPDDTAATAELLRIQAELRNIRHPQGLQLQVWDRRRGWRDLNTI
jgi:hypothetical protein